MSNKDTSPASAPAAHTAPTPATAAPATAVAPAPASAPAPAPAPAPAAAKPAMSPEYEAMLVKAVCRLLGCPAATAQRHVQIIKRAVALIPEIEKEG